MSEMFRAVFRRAYLQQNLENFVQKGVIESLEHTDLEEFTNLSALKLLLYLISDTLKDPISQLISKRNLYLCLSFHIDLLEVTASQAMDLFDYQDPYYFEYLSKILEFFVYCSKISNLKFNVLEKISTLIVVCCRIAISDAGALVVIYFPNVLDLYSKITKDCEKNAKDTLISVIDLSLETVDLTGFIGVNPPMDLGNSFLLTSDLLDLKISHCLQNHGKDLLNLKVMISNQYQCQDLVSGNQYSNFPKKIKDLNSKLSKLLIRQCLDNNQLLLTIFEDIDKSDRTIYKYQIKIWKELLINTKALSNEDKFPSLAIFEKCFEEFLQDAQDDSLNPILIDLFVMDYLPSVVRILRKCNKVSIKITNTSVLPEIGKAKSLIQETDGIVELLVQMTEKILKDLQEAKAMPRANSTGELDRPSLVMMNGLSLSPVKKELVQHIVPPKNEDDLFLVSLLPLYSLNSPELKDNLDLIKKQIKNLEPILILDRKLIPFPPAATSPPQEQRIRTPQKRITNL